MRIWLDADNCPAGVREIVSRAAIRNSIEAVFVANHPPPLAPSTFLKSVSAGGASQATDRYLLGAVQEGDMAITADIPLTAELVARGAVVIHPKGDLFTVENVRHRLSIRNFLAHLRSSGIDTKNSPRYRRGALFADVFDREIQKALRRRRSFDI